MLYDPKSELNLIGRKLYEAANYMDEHGHAKRILMDIEGRVCLLGAISMAVDGTKDGISDLVSQCENACAKHSGVSIGILVDWNNAPERTKDEVVNLLKETAMKCKQFA